MHDQTAMRAEGIAEQLRLYPGVKTEVDEGYRALAGELPGQVTAPPKKHQPNRQTGTPQPESPTESSEVVS